LFKVRTIQGLVLSCLSPKTVKESVKTLSKDALHDPLLLETENTYEDI